MRHRGKIESTINNARRCIELIDEFGSLAAFVWSYEPEGRSGRAELDWPMLTAQTTAPEAIKLSKDLKGRGWSFVGPTTVYAFMEAMGLVNDHVSACEFRESAERVRASFRRPSLFSGRLT